MLTAFLIIQFIFGFLAGWRGKTLWSLRKMERLKTNMLDYMKEITIPISVKKVDGQILVYNETTGEYLTQGTNYDDIFDKLNVLYPDKIFTAKPEVLEHE